VNPVRAKEHFAALGVLFSSKKIREASMFKIAIVTAMLGFGLVSSAQAGCLTGAAVGGVLGHMAGHHAVAGAAIGCAVGHHRAAKDKQLNQTNQENQSASH
jgi:hypothetical protein